jgi:neutral ceramidase
MLPGFDDLVLAFLADRIAEKVVAAFRDLQPACIGWSQEEIPGAALSLNRAYAPFLANVPPPSAAPNPLAAAKHADAMQEGGAARAAGTDPAATRPPRGPEGAVDSRLSVIRVDRRAPGASSCTGSVPIGAFATFGMHPTGLPNTYSLYHGDIFGYAVRVAEGELTKALGPVPGAPARDAAWNRESAAPGDHRVIVGLANGTDGDVSPRLYEQADSEARRLGRVLGAQIVRLSSAREGLAPAGAVDRLYRELRFAGARYDDDEGHRLCPRGALGAVSAGGARDGPTRVRIVPEMNAGFIPDQLDACHQAKLALQAGAPNPYDYPEIGAIALVRIGDGVLAAAPGELTTMSGFRIRAALAASLPAYAKVAIVGLTNHYLQYFATPEEYRFQFYEGASTLYGPHSEPFLTRHFGHLGALLGQRWSPPLGGAPVPVAPLNDLPDQAPVNRALPFEPSTSPNVRRWPGDEPLNRDQPEAPPVARVRRQLQQGYEFTIPSLPPLFTSDRRSLTVSVLEGGVVRDDDLGASLEVQELDGGKWRIRWVPDLAACDARCGKTYNLAIGGAISVVSSAFELICEAPPADGCAP